MSLNEPMPPAPSNGASATEADEETVLVGLYGAPDPDGVYRGERPFEPEDWS